MTRIFSKIKNIPQNLKATIVFAIASFATTGINYLTTPIFVRLLSQSEYGMVSIYNSVYSIVSTVATLTLSRPGVLTVGLYEHSEERWKYLSGMLGVIAVSSVAVFALMAITWPLLGSYINLPFSLVCLMLATCFLQPAMTFWTYKNRYEQSYKTTFWVTVGTALLAQVVSIFAVYYCKENTNFDLTSVRLWSAAAINLSAAGVLYVYICCKGKRFINVSLWKKSVVFALPLIPHYLGFAFLNGTDKIMIGTMISEEKAGIYSLASIVSMVSSLVWQALCVSITPFMYSCLGSKRFKNIQKNIYPLLVFIAVCCALISLAAPEIIWIFSTSEYAEAMYIIPSIAAGVFMHILYDVFSNVAFFHKKSVWIMVATVTAALVNVVLNYICIRRFGYLAAGYTTLASYSLLAMLHYAISRKVEREKIFDLKKCIMLSALVIVACMLCIPLYRLTLVRYVLIAGVAAAVVIKRNYFIDAIAHMGVK